MSPARASDTIGPKAFETKLKNPRSSVVMAERSRAYVCLYRDFLIDGWCIGTFFFETF